MAEALTDHTSNIEEWVDERGLVISVTKSIITLFTPQFAQCKTHGQVTLNNSLLPLERSPHILGVTFDPYSKLNAHVISIVSRASSRINIRKDLAGTNWDQQKETILLAYISFIRSLSIYAAAIWFHTVSPSLIPKFGPLNSHRLH